MCRQVFLQSVDASKKESIPGDCECEPEEEDGDGDNASRDECVFSDYQQCITHSKFCCSEANDRHHHIGAGLWIVQHGVKDGFVLEFCLQLPSSNNCIAMTNDVWKPGLCDG